SVKWLSANPDSDAGVPCALLGVDGKRGIAACALYPVDTGFVCTRPAVYPAHNNGCDNVDTAKAQPGTARSHAGEDHADDANHVYVPVSVFPGRSRALLGGKQYTVDYPAVFH